MRAPREREILRPFSQCQSRDASVAVRRAKRMRRAKPIDAKRFDPAFAQLIQRRTAHCAEANDDDIERFLHSRESAGRQFWPEKRSHPHPVGKTIEIEFLVR